VNVGMIRFDAKDEKENRTLLQYIIPGRKSAAVLTFSTPKPDFDKYLPVFEASARATKGGYESGSFSWVRLVATGGLCALFGVSVALIRKRRNANAGTPPMSPQKKSSRNVWDCPGCGKPVPIRLEQCRCGTAKPL
jgi:hypothetical protein